LSGKQTIPDKQKQKIINMKKQFLYLLISILFNLNSFGFCYPEEIITDTINDGPYIYFENDTIKAKWIENSALKEDIITFQKYPDIKAGFNLLFNYSDLKNAYFLKSYYRQNYSKVDSISVISDIHGEYDSYINLLKAADIIDDDLNWSFGTGHLVVLGDIFDRGDKVTEILWHLFGLEKQAVTAGGMVHVLLGNHEVMVLNNELGYINEKYIKVEAITNTYYSGLYSENTVLGKWLRSKPVVITINNCIFIHAGISVELIQRNMKIQEINRMFSRKIVGKDLQVIDKKADPRFLNGNDGPMWYRGYFLDSTFSESEVDSILGFYEKEHIVVGHTTYNDIKTLFDNKIFGIDAGIMNEQPGEILLYKEGIFYKVLITGRRIKL
jgi:hypothetical protein